MLARIDLRCKCAVHFSGDVLANEMGRAIMRAPRLKIRSDSYDGPIITCARAGQEKPASRDHRENFECDPPHWTRSLQCEAPHERRIKRHRM